jgi:RHS repeat-associated protein
VHLEIAETKRTQLGPPTGLLAGGRIAEKPHQGVAAQNATLHQAIAFSKPLTASGLPTFVYDSGRRSRCSGKERDAETGLDWFGTRYMSSAQGRFTSPDKPFADQDPYDPQSWNLYSYVRNNPLKFIDELGEAIKYASPALEVYSNTMRAQSPSYNAALQGFEGDGAPDMVFQVGDAGMDANGVDKAIGLASTSIAPGSTIYGTHDDPNAVIQVPDKLKSVTVTIDTSIAKDGSQVKSVMAHEVGHGNDARTNTAQYQSDGQRTKQTKGSTAHDSRPEEKRANDFRDRVKKEKGQFGKQNKQQNKQLEEAEKRRIKELEKQGAH